MIYTRNDGTFIIDVNGMPYHVIEEDTERWADVQQRISNGEEVSPEIPIQIDSRTEWNGQEWELPLPEKIVDAHTAVTVERDRRILLGFDFLGHKIQADQGSQDIAHQYLTKIIGNMATFPIIWRTMDNNYIQLTDSAHFMEFIGDMTTHIQTQFADSWVVKDAVDNAETIEEVESILQEYLNVNRERL